MTWQEVQKSYPHQWLLIEAIRAHSKENKRILDQISVIDFFPDSVKAMKNYSKLHREDRQRELYVFHTDREDLDITERYWHGIRGLQ